MNIAFMQRLFRWHLWMGCLIAPLLTLMSMTGCTLVFRHEIFEYLQRDVRCVKPGPAKLPVSSQLEALRSVHPDWTPTTLTISRRLDRSTLVQVTKPIPIVGSVPFVGIDPYSGQVLGEAEANLDLFDWVLSLHKTMLLGPDGRILVELVTSWAIVTVLSGTLLWLTQRRRTGRAQADGRQPRRSRLRIWHTNGGLILSVPILAILISGLCFTTIWSAWANYLTGSRLAFPTELLVSPPSEEPGEELWTRGGLLNDGLIMAASPENLVDRVVQKAQIQFPGRALRVSLPLLPGDSYCAHAMSDDGTRIFGLICLSSQDGSVLHLAPENRWKPSQAIRLSALAVHTGSFGGLPTKFLALLASLMLFVLSVTGPWMLLSRARTIGNLRTEFFMPPNDRRSWLMYGIILVLAVSLPTAGISVLIFLGIQWAVNQLRR